MKNSLSDVHISIEGFDNQVYWGWLGVCAELKRRLNALPAGRKVLVIETYPGVDYGELRKNLQSLLKPDTMLVSDDAALPQYIVNSMINRNLTDDRVFGIMDHSRMDEFFDNAKLSAMAEAISNMDGGLAIVYGTGAALVARGDILVYADLTRWEIQLRWRRGEQCNWLANNYCEEQLRKYKRGYFFEWRVADRHKRELIRDIDYMLDTNVHDDPKMCTGAAFHEGLRQAAAQPFEMVPYFDPGVWGGEWLEQRFNLEPTDNNYAWSFNGVPEENSLRLRYGDVDIEIPAIDLVFAQPRELLGEKVHARFGAEFPIRFDFLDTMGGGNLSLQVHPLTEYIQDRFGMHYTQDESYYMLDAGDDACVYLGVKTGVDPDAMIADLHEAESGEKPFPAEEYINRFPVKKHDHVLIPAGTIHCSGKNALVLEVSATPYIFTFKLWDWGRVGLDGRPRPVHIEHGSHVIQWDRDTEWVGRELLDRVEQVAEGDGWREERTGLHEREFIETRRLWFSDSVEQHTQGGVQMLMVVEGDGCVVSGPEGAFEFTARYAECFIIPAAVGAYTVRPLADGKLTALLRAYVRV